jgi:ABC-type oligopeptide transport system substrate-binding subunit
MEMLATSKLSSAACIAGLLMAPVAAVAHHSAAMFESEKTVTVSGTVTDFEYVNPHAWL